MPFTRIGAQDSAYTNDPSGPRSERRHCQFEQVLLRPRLKCVARESHQFYFFSEQH